VTGESRSPPGGATERIGGVREFRRGSHGARRGSHGTRLTNSRCWDGSSSLKLGFSSLHSTFSICRAPPFGAPRLAAAIDRLYRPTRRHCAFGPRPVSSIPCLLFASRLRSSKSSRSLPHSSFPSCPSSQNPLGSDSSLPDRLKVMAAGRWKYWNPAI